MDARLYDVTRRDVSGALAGAGQYEVMWLQGEELRDITDQLPQGENHVRGIAFLLHLKQIIRKQREC